MRSMAPVIENVPPLVSASLVLVGKSRAAPVATRAAAFCYGVLECGRRTGAFDPDGRTFRLLDTVDVITGVTDGRVIARTYGLYDDKFFTH